MDSSWAPSRLRWVCLLWLVTMNAGVAWDWSGLWYSRTLEMSVSGDAYNYSESDSQVQFTHDSGSYRCSTIPGIFTASANGELTASPALSEGDSGEAFVRVMLVEENLALAVHTEAIRNPWNPGLYVFSRFRVQVLSRSPLQVTLAPWETLSGRRDYYFAETAGAYPLNFAMTFHANSSWNPLKKTTEGYTFPSYAFLEKVTLTLNGDHLEGMTHPPHPTGNYTEQHVYAYQLPGKRILYLINYIFWGTPGGKGMLDYVGWWCTVQKPTLRDSASPPAPKGLVRGTVFDALSGLPLTGVEMRLGTETTQTDAQGAYEFRDLNAGTVRVEASKPCYEGAAAEMSVALGQTSVQDFRLALGSSPGLVLAFTEHPVADAAQADNPAAPGRFRREYFSGQKLRLSFTAANDQPLQLRFLLEILSLPDGLLVKSQTLECSYPTAGRWTNAFEVPISAELEPGYYRWKVRAVRMPCETEYPRALEASVSEQLHVCRGKPLILIHGVNGSPGSFGDLQSLLLESNHLATVSFDYSGDTDQAGDPKSIEQLAGDFTLPAREGSVRYTTNYFNQPKVDVVAHSMGGLVARAYMAGMADDGVPDRPYGNEIEKLVTFGSPFYGAEAWAEVGQWDLLGFPKAQLAQMKLGSRFLWTLHARASRNPFHLAVTGVQLLFDPATAGDFTDGAVGVLSAVAPSLAGESRCLAGYGHFQAIYPGIARVLRNQAGTHEGYRLAVEWLLGEGLSAGWDLSQLKFRTAPVMVRTLGPNGQAIHCHVTSGHPILPMLLIEPFDWVDIDWAIHANPSSLTGERSFFVEPIGGASRSFSPGRFPFDIPQATLTMTTFSLVPTADTENPPDGLTDAFEKYYWGEVYSGAEGSGDADADGLSNQVEQLFGLDPRDSESCLRVEPEAIRTRSEAGTTTTTVAVVTIPGFTYQLLASDTGTAPWTRVGAPVLGTGLRLNLVDQSDRTKRFYRLGVTLEP